MVSGKRSRTLPFFLQVTCVIIAVCLVLLTAALGLTLRYSLSTLQEKIDNSLSSTTSALASNSAIREALLQGQLPRTWAEYLDELVASTSDLDVITIADRNSLRLYHVVPERIGQTFVGGDEQRALAGESYFSDATGTMGFQHRHFSPVVGSDGTVLGFVMASATRSRMEALRSSITATYTKMMVGMVACTLLFSAGLAAYLQQFLRGARPEDLLKTYLTQTDILNSLDEGIISLDSKGRIRFVNQAAVSALGQHEALLLGQTADSLLLGEGGASLLGARGENLLTNRPNLLVNAVPLNSGNRWARQVLILKDKSEAFRRAEQLNGTRNIISTLRANNHEFMNKLQVISGLLQMGRAQDALQYIGTVSAIHAQLITPVMQLVHNANVAALILGKLDNMRELSIRMTLLANSHLPEHSRFLSTRELVIVVGNLLENAMEAVNAVTDQRERTIDLQITEDESGLLITIADSGVGIPAEHLPRICEAGFSTKATAGRGTGMHLIQTITERHGGSLDIDSEPGAGTAITLIFNQERGGYYP